MTASDSTPQVHFGGGEHAAIIEGRYANRHGLIAGATGTGKTVTLQVLAEGFSRLGVPVFLADVKGDLSGLGAAGMASSGVTKRVQKIGLPNHTLEPSPVVFWDLFQKDGHPLRTTVSEIGPVLLARLLELNDTQEGVLNVAFSVADDEGLALLDLKDLRSLLNFVGDNRKEISLRYGHVTSASLGAIARRLLTLERAGGENFFAEPALELRDVMTRDENGRGIINVLDARQLIMNPKLYSTFLLWLLAELFEELPEKGDLEKPELVFFFDEAHLLFDDPPKALLDQVEQVVRLIRSKGVGVYFVTQNPQDVPDDVLGQLGNRVQHALRAFTPRDQKVVRAAAQTFVPNPNLDTEAVLTQLGVGEALVSTLRDGGVPSMVDRCLIAPPHSRMGPLTKKERKVVFEGSAVGEKYNTTIDRESAFERLAKRAEQRALEAEKAEAAAEKARQTKKTGKTRTKRRSTRQSPLEAAVKSAARSMGTQLGRTLLRGILGAFKRGR
ncbi:MAG: helicase HerA-like domain-containing protein [Pseudomonadota bacterium]